MNLQTVDRSAKMRSSGAALDPDLRVLMDIGNGYRAAKIIFVASRMNLFTHLEGRTMGLAEICAALGTKPRPTEILLNALAALGFLHKEGGTYSNTPRSSRFLVQGKPQYLGHVMKFQDILWPAYGGLDHVLRKGRPQKNLGHWMKGSRDFTDEYFNGMRSIAQRPAREAAGHLHRPEDRTLLDVGAGPGTYSLALLERNPRLKAVLIDLPKTLRLTEKHLKAHPDRGRIRLEPGDYRALSLARGRFDIIILSHVTHNEGPLFNRKLFAQCFAALRPGGRLAVHDFMTDEGGTSPGFSALFSVHMMAFTDEGAVHRIADYEEWLREPGFAKIRRIPICRDSMTPSVLLVGVK